MKIRTVSAAILAASFASGSQAETGIDLLDTLDRTGAVYQGEGPFIAGAASGRDIVVIDNFSFSRFMTDFKASQLVIDGDIYTMEDVTISQREGGDGTIEADRITLEGADSLWALYMLGGFMPSRDANGEPIYAKTEEGYDLFFESQEPECGGLTSRGGVDRRLQADNLVVRGDMDSMPYGLASSEHFSAEQVVAEFHFQRDEDTCALEAVIRMELPRAYSISGDYLEARQATLNWDGAADMTFTEGHEGRTHVLEDVALVSAAGIRSMTIDRFSYEVDQNMVWYAFTCEAILGFDVFPQLNFEEAFSKGRHAISVSLDGIEIDVDEFFPQDVITDLGLGSVDSIAGDFRSGSELEDGIGRVDFDLSLPGLVRIDFDTALSFPEERSAALPPMLSDRIPVPSEILQVNLDRLSLSYSDEGIGALIESLTGYRADEIIAATYSDARPRISGKLPSFMIGSVDRAVAGIGQFVTRGGTLAIIPERPMNIATIAMQSIMNPAGIAGVEGATLNLGD